VHVRKLKQKLCCMKSQKSWEIIRNDYFLFGLVFIKKKLTKPKLLFKKTETGSNQSVSIRFFWTKTGSNRFDSVFPVLLDFLVWLVFLGLTRFFRFGFGSVRFFRF